MTEYDLGIVLAVIIALGITGNCVSLLVLLLGKRCRKLLCTTYLVALAVIDTAILALPALELCLYLLNTNIILRNINPFMCKFITFFLYYGGQLSSWIVVGVAVARALSIWMPMRSQVWRTKIPVPYLAIITVFFLVIDLPFLIDTERITVVFGEDVLNTVLSLNRTVTEKSFDKINETIGNFTIGRDEKLALFDGKPAELTFCLLTQSSIYANGKLLKPILVDICLVFAIPFTIITICNSLIMVKLIHSMRRIKKTQGGQTNIKDSRMISLTFRIFILSTVHLLSTGPIATAEVMIASSVDSSVFFSYTNIPMYRAFNLLFYLNSGVNFVLYCLFGHEFRQDLYDIIRLPKKGLRKIN